MYLEKCLSVVVAFCSHLLVGGVIFLVTPVSCRWCDTWPPCRRSKVGENVHTNLDANAADSIYNVSIKGVLTLPGCD